MWNDDEITPTGNGVLLKKYDLPEKADQLLLFPETAKTQLAEVVAVGPGSLDKSYQGVSFRHPMSVKPGDIVVLTQHPGGDVYGWGDKERLIVDEGSIVAVVEL